MTRPYFLILCIVMILTVFQRCIQNPAEGDRETEADVPVTGISNETKAEVVEIMKLSKQQVEQTINYTANLTAFEEIHMASSSPAKIEEIYVEVGDRVYKGQVLVHMDRTRLHQAIIQLKTLETNLSRLDTLIKTNTISQQQYDQVKAEYDLAKSNVEFLEENTQLKAPMNGIITGKYYEDEEFYSGAPNTAAGKAAILSIMQINPMKAIVNVSEQYYPRIEKSLRANITCDIYPEEKFTGKVFRIHPVIDPMSRSFQVEVSIPNASKKLRPGMYARVSLNIGTTEALLVPAIAVLKLQGSNVKYVFINNGGRAKMIEVEVVNRFDERLEIFSSELQEGDELVITGHSKLVDNTPITISNNI